VPAGFSVALAGWLACWDSLLACTSGLRGVLLTAGTAEVLLTWMELQLLCTVWVEAATPCSSSVLRLTPGVAQLASCTTEQHCC